MLVDETYYSYFSLILKKNSINLNNFVNEYNFYFDKFASNNNAQVKTVC